LNENPELNHLVMNPEHSAELERVGIERLDDWAQGVAGLAPDFIKLDAEGHEAAVVAGAEALLAGSAALIMFELKHGAQINHGLIEEFTSRGFAIYRLMPGLGILVPFRVEDQGAVDGFLLNLFAAKAETADALAARKLLVRELPKPVSQDPGESAAAAEARATTLFLRAMREHGAAVKVAALIESGRAIAHACQQDATLARLSGFARIHRRRRGAGGRDAPHPGGRAGDGVRCDPCRSPSRGGSVECATQRDDDGPGTDRGQPDDRLHHVVRILRLLCRCRPVARTHCAIAGKACRPGNPAGAPGTPSATFRDACRPPDCAGCGGRAGNAPGRQPEPGVLERHAAASLIPAANNPRPFAQRG
jgi:hypothetical protein